MNNKLNLVYNIKSTIMFFGKVITQSEPFIYSEQTVDETVGDVISISNVALAPNSNVILFPS